MLEEPSSSLLGVAKLWRNREALEQMELPVEIQCISVIFNFCICFFKVGVCTIFYKRSVFSHTEWLKVTFTFMWQLSARARIRVHFVLNIKCKKEAEGTLYRALQ